MNELTPDEHKILVDAIHDSVAVVHKGRMMNERIEQLLEQARAECFRFGNKPATTVGYDELEKFAELIVRECANVADRAEENGCEWIGGNILIHFGVRE